MLVVVFMVARGEPSTIDEVNASKCEITCDGRPVVFDVHDNKRYLWSFKVPTNATCRHVNLMKKSRERMPAARAAQSCLGDQ